MEKENCFYFLFVIYLHIDFYNVDPAAWNQEVYMYILSPFPI